MRLLLKIIAALLLAYAAAFVITVTLNPEVRLWRDVIRLRDQAIEEARRKSPDKPVIFFTGGSSCAFSVDPAIIERETGMPAVNLGLPVACGRDYILHQALRRCRSGDILVLALEPDLVCFPNKGDVPSRLGYGLEASMGNPVSAAIHSTGGRFQGTSGWLSVFRPGARYFMVLVGRSLGNKGYRYKMTDFRYGGRMETPIRPKEYDPSPVKTVRSPDASGKNFLELAASLAARKGVRIAYSMPWRLTQPAAVAPNREANRAINSEIATIMPVLSDPGLGCASDSSLYSDSEWHLGADGSRMRSEALSSAIRDWLHISK